jgi:hypothetical protein
MLLNNCTIYAFIASFVQKYLKIFSNLTNHPQLQKYLTNSLETRRSLSATLPHVYLNKKTNNSVKFNYPVII